MKGVILIGSSTDPSSTEVEIHLFYKKRFNYTLKHLEVHLDSGTEI